MSIIDIARFGGARGNQIVVYLLIIGFGSRFTIDSCKFFFSGGVIVRYGYRRAVAQTY